MALMPERLRIADIDLTFHGRAAVTDAWVATLADVLDKLPPPVVYKDPAGVLHAVDGVQTLHAAVSKGHTEWPCTVIEGTEDDAREAAAKANLDAGDRQPLTNADKRHKVKLLLVSPTWRGRTDGVVAEVLGVSEPFVGKVRDELHTRNGLESPRIRIDKNGRAIDTRAIGKGSDYAKALAFVSHALSNGRDAYLTIVGGRVTATSRALTASAPFPGSFDFQPKASVFIEAVGRTGATWRQLPDRSVVVERAGLSMRVLVTTAPLPVIAPAGDEIRVGPHLLSTLQRLTPWFGESGVLFTRARAYVANGRVAVSLDITESVFERDLRLSPEAVRAVVDIEATPTRAQLQGDDLFLHFDGDRWFRCTIGTPAPNVAEEEVEHRPSNPLKVTLPFDTLEKLREHVGARATVVLCEGAASTAYPADAGTYVEVPGLPEVGAFPLDELMRLEGVASSLEVEGEGDAFWQASGLRGRVLRSNRPEATESTHQLCPTCGAEWS